MDPCQGLQKQSGLCAGTSFVATKSLTVKCQPRGSLLFFSGFLSENVQVTFQ